MENSEKEYQVIVSDRFAEMLVNHVRFVAQVSRQAAEKLRKAIVKQIRTLEHMPQRNNWFNVELIQTNKYRKLVVEKRYLILYQIKDDCVYVDYILDCRQDYPWLFYPEL